ncbi:MAG: hypothetical protein JST16_15680 [Bdellovibrionales bacterium]|nr:hypothetical protein [Bdellovibrionales bacterium]
MKRLALLTATALTLLGAGGCASNSVSKRPLDLPFYQVYQGTYDSVWNATVRVLDIYSITVASRDAGLLQTEWSDFRYNRELYEVPDKIDHLEEVRYRLKIKLSKGIVSQTGQPAVRVQVTKELEEYKNFFTDWQRMPTDEMEEKVILYRIGHRIRITDALKRKTVGSGHN